MIYTGTKKCTNGDYEKEAQINCVQHISDKVLTSTTAPRYLSGEFDEFDDNTGGDTDINEDPRESALLRSIVVADIATDNKVKDMGRRKNRVRLSKSVVEYYSWAQLLSGVQRERHVVYFIGRAKIQTGLNIQWNLGLERDWI